MDDDHRPDHVGIDLWRAFRAYEARMYAAVRTAGFDDVGVADSDILVHVGPKGITLTGIARARGVSKQAVQAPVRSLAQRGYLEIAPDPDDARAKLVRHTAKGIALVRALADAKRDLHAEVQALTGADGLRDLRATLDRIADALEPPAE